MPDLSNQIPLDPEEPGIVSSSGACWRPRGIIGRILAELNCTIHALRPLLFHEACGSDSCLKGLRLSASSCNPPSGLAEPD